MNTGDALRKALFVIPSLNGGALLERMLPSLDIPRDIVVVLDQGSTDRTAEICERAGVALVQLGTPKTYTTACNIGIELARRRNCEFIYIANNDIIFLTEVGRELMDEMLGDPRLAIVAPSQQLIEAESDPKVAYRVRFDLSNMRFVHDFDAPPGECRRIESDFCELTCALIRMRALDDVGGLDDEFGFYHEDADLCFRLGMGAYNSAYLPQSQIAHYHSSTMSLQKSGVKDAYLRKNKDLFSRKFRGFGVNHADHGSDSTNSWNIINKYLDRYLLKFGLVDCTRPSLIFSHPGTEPFDYLYTVWETTRLPAQWRERLDEYRAVFVPSAWGRGVLRAHGFENAHYVPLGVETDVFQPWGGRERFYDEKTFLWFANNQFRKGLDVMLRAWSQFHAMRQNVRLIIVGVGVLVDGPGRRWKNFLVSDRPESGLAFFEIIRPLSDADVAAMYRSVDVYVSTSRAEGFGFTVAEAMACGTQVVFGDYSSTSEFCFEGALCYPGVECPADYTDKGYADVGAWWEPDMSGLLRCLHEACSMSSAEQRALSRKSMLHIRGRYTWRHTCFHLRKALQQIQEQKDVGHIEAPPESRPAEQSLLAFAKRLDSEGRRRAKKDKATFQAFSGFDPAYYLEQNRDVAEVGYDPLAHYLNHGWQEGRDPSRHFTTQQLLAANVLAREMLLKQVEVGASVSTRPSQYVLKRVKRRLDDLRTRIYSASKLNWRRSLRAAAAPRRPLFVGYVEAALGFGESLRGMLAALAAAKLEFSIYPLNKNVETRLIAPFMKDKYDISGPHDINIFELAIDQLPHATKNIGATTRSGAYNILRTYCELAQAPEKWKANLQHVSEIWAPTRFVADALRPIFDGPISLIPPCVDVSAGLKFDRARFGLHEDVFYYLFSFDYYSTPARKNPLGVAAAFVEAFGDLPDARVGLVIKSEGPSEQHYRVKATLDKFVGQDHRIVLIEESLTRDETLSLLRCVDCYVSLHRAEGFGVGMAEALALGKAVIGTDYSGSTDFLSEDTGFPVSFSLRKLRDGEYYDGDGQTWAEPDMTSAISAVRFAFENEAVRTERAKKGREFIRSRYSAENVASAVMQRLKEIEVELGVKGHDKIKVSSGGGGRPDVPTGP